MGYKMKGPSLLKMVSALKKDAKTGHGAKGFPDTVYRADGTAKLTSQIDEEMLDLKPSIGPKGKFVNYSENGKKIKYYYKNPKEQSDFSDLEKYDDDRG